MRTEVEVLDGGGVDISCLPVEPLRRRKMLRGAAEHIADNVVVLGEAHEE